MGVCVNKNTQHMIDKINNRDFTNIRDDILKSNVISLAEAVEELDVKNTLIFFRMMPKDVAADVFSYLPPDKQEEIIDSITPQEIREILEELYFDDMIDMFEELPANMVKKLLQHTPKNQRNLINEFLKYPENSAGSVMTIEYMSLKKNLTVKESIYYIRKKEFDKETIYDCFITDSSRRLEGIISLRKLVTTPDDVMIGNVMDREIISVQTTDDQELVAQLFKKYDLLAMPVVDHENRLLGIITIDDIIDVIDDEYTEDFEIMAGMMPSKKEYLDSTPLILAKNRVVWLLVLMISATFTQKIISGYENLLSRAVILMSFVPMLMNTGGNAGSQAATLIIRGLSLEEIETTDIFKIIKKELAVSIIVGFILAVVNFLRIVYLEHVDMTTAAAVSLTMICTVILANFTGGVLPILARKLKLDPAIMASPLISTVLDATTLLVYFSIANKMLNLTGI